MCGISIHSPSDFEKYQREAERARDNARAAPLAHFHQKSFDVETQVGPVLLYGFTTPL
jgi:hypothetical protein